MDIIELIGDEKKIKIIKEIANSESDTISIREVSRKTKIPVSTVYRIFKEFEEKGILTSKNFGERKVYFINENINLSYFKQDPLKKFIELVKDYVSEIRLITRSSKGANIVVITDNITNYKKAENQFESKSFKIQSIVLNAEQFQRLKQMGMVKEGEVIYKK